MRNVAELFSPSAPLVSSSANDRDGLRQFVAHGCGRPQILNRVAAFGDGLISPIESAVQRLDGLSGMLGQQVTCTLKAEHQPLKALQQRVVQLPRDARPLGDAFIQQCICGLLPLRNVHDCTDEIQIRKPTNGGPPDGVHVLDRTISELQAILMLKVGVITRIHLHLLYEAGAVVGVDNIYNHRKCRGDVRIEAEDSVRFARPEQIAGRRVPAPAAGLTQGLRFGQKRFASTDGLPPPAFSGCSERSCRIPLPGFPSRPG